MPGSKIRYQLTINNGCRPGKLCFSYRSTQNITIGIGRKGAVLNCSIGNNYLPDFENTYLDNLLKEGIKRIALLHILQYGTPITIKSAVLLVLNKRNQLSPIDCTNHFQLYQMFDGGKLRSIGGEWKNPVIQQRVLDHRKSGSEISRAVAALYAYLFSKTKDKETERFSYLWIAMNGFLSAKYPELGRDDRRKLNAFVDEYKFGAFVLDGHTREKICEKAKWELMKIPEPITMENLGDDVHKSFPEFIRKVQEQKDTYRIKDFDVSAYGFLITDFPYYLRCNLFHGDKPIELFSFETDWELKSLRIVNNLLEEFLDKNLYTLFETKPESLE